MFNLEEAIAGWRRQMREGGVRTPDLLEELEGHLRDDVEQQARGGVDLEQAFARARARMGQPAALRSEFDKRGKWSRALQAAMGVLTMTIWEPRLPRVSPEQMKRAALALAGIPNSYGAADSPADIEPRWATYLRSGALFGPALFFWSVEALVAAPKLREVCLRANFGVDDLPAWIRVLLDLMNYAVAHWMAFAGVAGVALLALEWRSRRWPRYRRAVLGAAAFALNLAVLLAISFSGIMALVAASKLMSLVK